MKMKFTFALVLSLTSLVSYSQDSTKTKFNREIGFNTYFILNEIFESSQTPFSLMYKKYSSENKATRFGINTDIQLLKTSGEGNLPQNTYSNISRVSLSLVFGKEKQDRLSKSWIWYYGIDVLPSFGYFKQDSYQSDEKSHEYKNLSFGVSGRPFLGIRFDISPRLYLSAEASLSLSYSHNSFKEQSFNPTTMVRDTKSDNIGLSLDPATGIFLFYRF